MRLVEDDAFRAEFVEFLDDHAPALPAPWELEPASAGIPDWARDWQAALFDHGWLMPENPPELGGRHADPDQVLVYLDEMVTRGLPRSLHFPGYAIAAPTLVEFGTAEQRALAPRALRGDDVWCIGMSEPDAGSDLSALRTRADSAPDGGFVLRGRKIWTSYAQWADRCLCYARTGGGRGSGGISALVVEMDAPGLGVRPIRQITGSWEFAEVVFDEVAVPPEALIGERDAGWRLARASLDHERRGLAVEWLAGLVRIADAMEALVGRKGATAASERVAVARRRVSALRALGMRELAAPPAHGAATPSLLKLTASELGQELLDLATELLAGEAVLGGDRAGAAAPLVGGLFRSYADTIGGGTSEIQRDLLAGALVGLGR